MIKTTITKDHEVEARDVGIDLNSLQSHMMPDTIRRGNKLSQKAKQRGFWLGVDAPNLAHNLGALLR